MQLKQYLEQVSQTALAEKLGVSQGLISHWLTGRVRITAENAISIEDATDGKVTRYELRPDVFGLALPGEDRRHRDKPTAAGEGADGAPTQTSTADAAAKTGTDA